MLQSTLVAALFAAFVGCVPLSERADSSRFKFYNLKTPLSGPCDLVEGPDGALWGESLLVNHIFRIDPSTGNVQEFPIPFTNPATGALTGLTPAQDRTELSCAIRKGDDGNLYASNGLRNQLVKINPTTHEIKVFTPQPYNPVGDLQPFNDLYSAKDGIYFTQTSGNVISFFDFKDQKFKNYNIPTPASFPLGVYVASDGRVVVTELLGNKMIFLNGSSGAITEHPLPELAQMPAVVRAETGGDIYFSLFTGNGVGKISLATGAIQLFHTDRPGLLGAEDTIDSDNNIWLSFFNENVLGKFDTKTQKFSFVDFPDSVTTAPIGIPPYVDVAVNYGPGNAIWFTDISHNRVGRYAL